VTLLDKAVVLEVDYFKEPLKAADAAVGEQLGIELGDVVDEEGLVHVGLQVGVFGHELGEPLEADLTVALEDRTLREALPDGLGLGGAEPELALFQQVFHEVEALLDLGHVAEAAVGEEKLRVDGLGGGGD